MDRTTLRFSPEHEWVRPEADDEAVVGVTDYAAGELGDIVFVELPEVGTVVEAGQSIGTIEAVKTVADLYAPVSGTVTAVNDAIADNPDLVSKSPYEDGWLVRIHMSDPAELDGLMDDAAYREMVGQA